MKEKVLELLKQSDGYISGQEICRKLGVSRTAVWKDIRLLKEEGYEVLAVNNKGYRLISEPDIVTPEKIKEYLTTNEFGKEIFYFDEVDSTNIRAKLSGETGGAHGTLFVANEQLSGRGRKGRSWETPKGSSIAMTFLLRPKIDIQNISGLTILSAVAVAKALRDVASIEAKIKWPNDVVVNGKKICGILTEMSSEGTDINYVVVGIGINIFMTEFEPELSDKATSVRIENGTGCDRSKLTAFVANHFEALYLKFREKGNLDFLIDEYNALLVNKDRQVYVIEGENRTEYTALGLACNGGLKVLDANGNEEIIISGEVSVRGIYGYV